MTRVIAVVAALAFVAGIVSLVVEGPDAAGSSPVELVVSEGGRARIEGPGRDRSVGAGRHDVSAGQTVTALNGSMRLDLGDGAALELRDGFAGSDGVAPEASAVTVGRRPALVAGEVLAVAGDEALEVVAGGTAVSVERGVTRLHRALTLTTAVYEGAARIDSAGRSVAVAALRQASVPGLGLVPGRPAALVYDEVDPWDQRHLGEAIDLTEALDARARGFTAQLDTGEGRTAGFYELVFPELDGEPAFATTFRVRPPGEQLVGTAIALEGEGDDVGTRLAEVFAFRDDGAEWGLVALDQGAARGPLLARIDEALDRSPLLFAGPPPTGGPPPSPPAPPPVPAPPTTEPPPPPEEPDEPDEPDDPGPDNPLPPPLDGPTDPVFELIEGLLPSDQDTDPSGGLLEPVDPVVDAVTDEATSLLGGVGDVLGTTGGSGEEG